MAKTWSVFLALTLANVVTLCEPGMFDSLGNLGKFTIE